MIRNDGTALLVVDAIELVNDGGGAFVLSRPEQRSELEVPGRDVSPETCDADSDCSGEQRCNSARSLCILPDEAVSVPYTIEFSPTAEGTFEGLLRVSTSDPLLTEVEIQVIGRSALAPVALIAPVQGFRPSDVVVLDGRPSYDPADRPLTYEWLLPDDYPNDGRPPGDNTTTLTADSAMPWLASLVGVAAGRYYVELRVRNDLGIYNLDRQIVSLESIPDTAVYVELVWDNLVADVDLHAVPSGGALFGPGSCYFATCLEGDAPEPDFCGDSGGQVSLSNDVRGGFGPEALRLSGGCSGDVALFVHHRAVPREHGPLLANMSVRIYCGGVLSGELYQPVERPRTLWEVGSLDLSTCELTPSGIVTQGVAGPPK